MNWNEFIQLEEANNDVVTLKKMYVDITGDLVAGLLLSQIVYWNLPSKKTKAKRCGEWLIKQRKDWWEEIRITSRQYDRAMKILENKFRIVSTEIHKSNYYNGKRAVHIKLNYQQLTDKIVKYIENKDNLKSPNGDLVESKSPSGDYALSPNSDLEINKSVISSIAENTTEITTETTFEPVEKTTDSTNAIPKNHDPINKKQLHNILKQHFEMGSEKIHGSPYYHDAKEAKAIDNIIKRATTNIRDGPDTYIQAYGVIKQKAEWLYLKIINPKNDFWAEQPFCPSSLLTHWNRLIEGKPVTKKRDNIFMGVSENVLNQLREV